MANSEYAIDHVLTSIRIASDFTTGYRFDPDDVAAGIKDDLLEDGLIEVDGPSPKFGYFTAKLSPKGRFAMAYRDYDRLHGTNSFDVFMSEPYPPIPTYRTI